MLSFRRRFPPPYRSRGIHIRSGCCVGQKYQSEVPKAEGLLARRHLQHLRYHPHHPGHARLLPAMCEMIMLTLRDWRDAYLFFFLFLLLLILWLYVRRLQRGLHLVRQLRERRQGGSGEIEQSGGCRLPL